VRAVADLRRELLAVDFRAARRRRVRVPLVEEEAVDLLVAREVLALDEHLSDLERQPGAEASLDEVLLRAGERRRHGDLLDADRLAFDDVDHDLERLVLAVRDEVGVDVGAVVAARLVEATDAIEVADE